MSTKRSRRILATSAAMVAALALGACGNGDGDESADGATTGGGDSAEVTTIGFVAVGPEGAWRQANEQNIQDTFTEDAGFSLKFAPATNLDQKDRKSTRLNSSHVAISYAVFCLKKKKKNKADETKVKERIED